LKGALERYFRDSFAELAVAGHGRVGWADCDLGVVSGHRSMRPVGSSYGSHTLSTYNRELQGALNYKDDTMAEANLRESATRINNKQGSMNGILEHLENLGHECAPYVEGLNVELLEFQRQTLQWALEREKVPGGIQSFSWVKVPSVGEPNSELYFNPILQRFRRDKPLVVRGGFIAEEMGLGKIDRERLSSCVPDPSMLTFYYACFDFCI
jgi:hypothetical protein